MAPASGLKELESRRPKSLYNFSEKPEILSDHTDFQKLLTVAFV